MGENTGALDSALMNITYFYNRDVRESVDKAQKMLGPAMTLVLGGMLAFVVWAVQWLVQIALGVVFLLRENVSFRDIQHAEEAGQEPAVQE